MIQRTITTRRMPAWLMRVTSTVTRCHLIGSITAAALIGCIALAWSQNRVDVATIQYDGKVIDIRDAASLIEHAGRWRQLYTINYLESQSIDRRVESIESWLPISVDWPNTQQEIQSIGAATGLSILSIKRGDQHIGTRVGVLAVSCEVQGTYGSLCRFLNELNDREHPIACSEIKLDRTMQVDSSRDDIALPRCKATVSLRIPFGAAGTAAQRLLSKGTKNAT